MSGVEVIERWNSRDAFVDMKWGRDRRRRRIGTGVGRRDQRSVIIEDNASRGCGGKVIVDVRCWVQMMASDVAQRIRGRISQNDVLITSGGGELCWGRIGILV